MPEHIKGESREEWMERCIPVVIKEGKTQEEASGQCGGMYDSWKEEDKTKATKKEPEVYDIDNVEIIAAGTWDTSSGKKAFTENDLQEVVDNYHIITEKGESNIPIKLGHDDNQELLQADGYPSAGWVTNLRKKADKIVADFKAIPKVIYKIIQGKGYTSVSPEIWGKYKDSNSKKTYKNVLSAVALLGKEHKAMTTLKDLVSVYSHEDNAEEIMVFSMEKPVIKKSKTEVDMDEVERLTQERDELKVKVEKFSKEAEASTTEKEELKNSLNEANEKLEKFKKDSYNTKVEAFIEKYKKDKKILPSQEDNFRLMLSSIAENEVVKFSKDGKEEEGNAFDLIGSILDVNPDLVELDEFSREEGNDEDIETEKKTDELGNPIEDTKEAAKLDKFMKENEITDVMEGFERARSEGVI